MAEPLSNSYLTGTGPDDCLHCVKISPHGARQTFKCKRCGKSNFCALAMTVHLEKCQGIQVSTADIASSSAPLDEASAPLFDDRDAFFAVRGINKLFHSTSDPKKCSLLKQEFDKHCGPKPGEETRNQAIIGFRAAYDAAHRDNRNEPPVDQGVLRGPCSECCKGVDFKTNLFFKNWLGDLGCSGSITPYRDFFHRHQSFGSESVWRHLEEGTDLCMAQGKVTIDVSCKTLTKRDFLQSGIVKDAIRYDDYMENFAEEGEQFPSEEIPDFSDLKVRIFSKTLYLIAKDFSDDAAYALDRLDFCTEESQVDHADWADVPGDYVLAGPGDSAQARLDIHQIAKALLDNRLKSKNSRSVPDRIELQAVWYADWPADHFEDCACVIDSAGFLVLINHLAWQRTPVDGRALTRVLVGPTDSSVQFIRHPSSDLEILPDPQTPPPRYASVLVRQDPVSAHDGGLFVLGSGGEINQIFGIGESENAYFVPPSDTPAV